MPDQLLDCKRALAWVREHIAEYGGDPDCIVVTGGSAGGHLTAIAALTANDPDFQPGFESVDTRSPSPCRSTASTTSPTRRGSRSAEPLRRSSNGRS